jgi:hypothetical protein
VTTGVNLNFFFAFSLIGIFDDGITPLNNNRFEEIFGRQHRSLDSLGGGYLIKKRRYAPRNSALDTLGGANLLKK